MTRGEGVIDQPSVSAIRCIELNVPDLEKSARFYEDVWCLAPVARDNGSCYLRGTGAEHNTVVLHGDAKLAVAAIGFAAPGKAAVDGLHARVKGSGATLLSDPAALERPGGGYGFSLLHPEGWTVSISSDVQEHGDAEDAIDRPRRFSHVALGAEDAEAACAFMIDNFGFRISDRNGVINFLRCDANHHSIAFAQTGAAFVHHVSYEMPGFDAVMRGAGRLKEMGYPLEWGVGRHGPGDNIFSYFIEPNGFMNEYTAEMHQVDEATYKTGTPEEWDRPANRRDQWGFSDPPTEAMKKTQASQALLPAG